MGPFGSGRGGLDSGSFGICSVMLAQLAGQRYSSACTAQSFIVDVTSQNFVKPIADSDRKNLVSEEKPIAIMVTTQVLHP